MVTHAHKNDRMLQAETNHLYSDLMSAEKKRIGLILSGGGARGAYQVGVMRAIGRELPAAIVPFQVISGVSVGAINAASLASGAHNMKNAIEKLAQLWGGLTSGSVFDVSAGHVGLRLAHWLGHFLFNWAGVSAPPSILSNAPLRELLGREINFTKLHENLNGPALDALSITASSYNEGLAIAFYQGSMEAEEWRRSRRAGQKTSFSVDHIMASAALPFVFPATQVDGEYFGDGALRQIAPLSPAIHLGAEKLLVIGARDAKSSVPPETVAPYPSIGQISGQLLDIVFNDNLEADVERLKRINSTLETMLPERRENIGLRHIDVLMVRPSRDIREIAGEHAHEMPWTVKTILRAMGAMRAPWVLPSYLLFEPGYICALMDLGEQDAMAQMEEIKDFLEI